MRSDAEQHALWLKTVSRVASGYAELLQGNYVEAYECFLQVRDPRITPKFFLHWHWRLYGQLGMTEARLQVGDIADAHRNADEFLRSALSHPCPNMHSFAWELKARIARDENDFEGAQECINKALAIIDKFDIPVAAWQIHRTAWELYRDQGHQERADGHRTCSKELILKIADSFEPGEPLRESLLTAAPVRLIFGRAASV
jgi:tetratricopeptide (TPR) repeat protein